MCDNPNCKLEENKMMAQALADARALAGSNPRNGSVFSQSADKSIRRMSWAVPLIALVIIIAMAVGSDRKVLKDSESMLEIHEVRLDQLEQQFERHLGRLESIDDKLEKVIYALRELRTIKTDEGP